jgi:hypothetical protein
LGKTQAANGVTTFNRPVAKTRHAAKALTSVLEHERSCSRQQQAACWLLTLFGTQGEFNVPLATPQTTRATDVNLDACSFLIAGEEPSAARDARPRKQNQAWFVSILIRDMAAATSMLRARCASEHSGTLAVPSCQLHALAVPSRQLHDARYFRPTSTHVQTKSIVSVSGSGATRRRSQCPALPTSVCSIEIFAALDDARGNRAARSALH